MIGGQAYPNGVAFYTDEVRVRAFRGRGQTIQIEVSRRAGSHRRLMERVGSIPFVRGLALMCDVLLTHWKLYVAGLLFGLVFSGLLLFLMRDSLLQNRSSNGAVQEFEGYMYILFSSIIVMAFLAIRFSSVSRYHGAEHKLILAYETYKSVEREKILAASRVSASCGSNLFVFQVLCFCLLSIFQLPFWSKVILSFSFGYEIFLFDERGRWGWVLSPFYGMSRWLQGWVLTSKPTNKELEVAECAFRVLLDEVNGQSLREERNHGTRMLQRQIRCKHPEESRGSGRSTQV